MRIRYLVLVAALIVLASRLAAAQTTTITVTNQGTSAYLFNGTNPNGTLTLIRGQTYIFNVTVSGHPFHITTAPGIPTQDVAAAGFPGLTGQGAQMSTLTFPVPLTGASSLFYQCGNHTAMTGSINLVAATVPATNRWTLIGLGALVVLAGGLSLRRRLSLR
jgi:hypothetical protein